MESMTLGDRVNRSMKAPGWPSPRATVTSRRFSPWMRAWRS